MRKQKYSAQAIVQFLHENGFSDNMIAKAIGRTRVTILRIRQGIQSGYQCEDDLNSLLRLTKL